MATRTSLRMNFAVLGCLVAATAASPALGAARDNEAGVASSSDDVANHGGGGSSDSSEKSSKTKPTKQAPKSTTPSSEADAESSDGVEPSDEPEADEVVSNSPEKKTVSGGEKNTSHAGQFSVRLALGSAYRIITRYDDSPPCSETLNDQGDPKTLCGFWAPMTLDSAIGFAPLAGVEPFLWGRFGLAKERVTNTTPLVILGAGVRLYTMSDSAFKFFIEPAVGIELDKETSPKTNNVATRQPAQHKQDFIARLSIGPQYDFARNVGAYASVGLTVGMLRSLQSWMDFHFGLQARFP